MLPQTRRQRQRQRNPHARLYGDFHMDRLLQLMARHIPEHASRSAKIELEELYKRFSDLNGQVLLAKNRVHESTAELSAAKDTIAQLRTR